MMIASSIAHPLVVREPFSHTLDLRVVCVLCLLQIRTMPAKYSKSSVITASWEVSPECSTARRGGPTA